MGQFGGHNGRALRTGDVLKIKSLPLETGKKIDQSILPEISHFHELRVIYGPHGAPDFFTDNDIDMFFKTEWEVHYNSSRTGIRLVGPKPEWARSDGGEAGLYPSNIHDNAYAFGTVDFTGDMPIILGPDGPSLGGFVCPATVITADLWKLGQLKSGDKVQFIPVSLETAAALEKSQIEQIKSLKPVEVSVQKQSVETPVLMTLSEDEVGDQVVYRAAGDHFILVEYGELILDIRLRFRAHRLMQYIQKNTAAGIEELTPGIRSLQVHYDSQKISYQDLLEYLKQAELEISTQLTEASVPSRIVYLPVSWQDEVAKLAAEKYMQLVRENAPWCPDNLEFIRRINGMESIDQVKEIIFNSSYLVMGLGDVYLGAPVATPIDPRQRLVTTKYNPARTWTAENSVGIGGSYLCVYGMEGPGGYQLFGRTLQMWNRYYQTKEFSKPWLMRFFDQIRFYEVTHDELMQIRKYFPQGRYSLKIEESTFSLKEYEDFLEKNKEEIQSFQNHRNEAFQEELQRWHQNGLFNFEVEESQNTEEAFTLPEGAQALDRPVSGSIWQIQVKKGDRIQAEQVLMVLESMKMEIPIVATQSGIVEQILLKQGQTVNAGQVLLVIKEE